MANLSIPSFIEPEEVAELETKGARKINLLESFLEDLFEIRNPKYYKQEVPEEYYKFKKDLLESNKNLGTWIYYPWLNTICLCPSEEIFYEVITARNRPLISWEEQLKYYNFNVGIVGLSVGQSAALTLIRTGGAKNIKIADFDTISPSNLNRINFGVPEIGKSKTEVVAKRLYEINPYLNIKLFEEGLTPQNIEDFFQENFKINVVIDACDSFPIKILLREYAKKYKVPVLMATDLGDGSLLDFERYDKDDTIEMFGGRLKTIKPDDSFMGKALKIISPENIPMSLLEVLPEIGKSTPTHPQLATSVFFSGVLISYIVRRLANNKDVIDDRYHIELEEHFDPNHRNKEYLTYKNKKIEDLKKFLGME